MKITIKEIAKRADVSTATVSRVINGQSGYNDETRQRVLDIIEETGYKGNASALNEYNKPKVDKLVAILVPDLETNFYARIITGIEKVAREAGYSVLICNTGKEGQNAYEDIDVLKKRKVSGIALIGISLDDQLYTKLEKTKITYILISTMSYKYQVPYIKVDSFQAAYAAVNYLLSQGHIQIAMIAGTSTGGTSNREMGYRKAMEDASLKVNESRIFYGDFSFESGKSGMKKLLDSDKEITAVFAASDDMAVGAISAAYERCIAVPMSLSVIGYDNTKVAEMSNPPLTTIAQPLYEMGIQGMKMLIDFIETKVKPSSVVMPFQLKERRSVGTCQR